MGLSAVLFTTTYGWRHIGCFRDHPHRAIAGGIRFRGPVARCARFARAHHWGFFSVQYGGECFTGPISYTRHFGRYGRAHNCHHGTGGGWANDVYQTHRRYWDHHFRRRHRYLTLYHRHFAHYRHLANAQRKRLRGYNLRYSASHRAAVHWAKLYTKYAHAANREGRQANAWKKRHAAYVRGFHRVKGACNRTMRKWAHGANVMAARQRAYYRRYKVYKAKANLFRRRFIAARRAFHVRKAQRNRAHTLYNKYARTAHVYLVHYRRYHRAALVQRRRLNSYNRLYAAAHRSQVRWARLYVRYAHAANAQGKIANRYRRSHRVHYKRYRTYRHLARVYHHRYAVSLKRFRVRAAQRKRAYALYNRYVHISNAWARKYNHLRRHG